MSQNPRPNQRPKEKLEPKSKNLVHIHMPMVRNYSTGGGHLPGDTITEGDEKVVTKKWQGYPPENLNLVGKPMPALPEVDIPRWTGKAQYATRVWFPNLLYVKLLTSPHPRATIKGLDTSKAEKMPGVAYILTYKNAPSTYPMNQELDFQGELVAFVAAETEDQAEDAVEAIDVEYNVLPFASSLSQVMAPNAVDLRHGEGNVIKLPPSDPESDPKASSVTKHGDVEKGFAESDIIKEFTY